jgi:hypothetical protein
MSTMEVKSWQLANLKLPLAQMNENNSHGWGGGRDFVCLATSCIKVSRMSSTSFAGKFPFSINAFLRENIVLSGE